MHFDERKGEYIPRTTLNMMRIRLRDLAIRRENYLKIIGLPVLAIIAIVLNFADLKSGLAEFMYHNLAKNRIEIKNSEYYHRGTICADASSIVVSHYVSIGFGTEDVSDGFGIYGHAIMQCFNDGSAQPFILRINNAPDKDDLKIPGDTSDD